MELASAGSQVVDTVNISIHTEDLAANYKKILRLSYDVIITYDNCKSNLR